MIRHLLDEDDGEYSVDEEGNFVVEYDYDEESGRELTVWLAVEEDSTYSVHVATDKNFPREQWDRLVWICNSWNAAEPYPAAYLYIGEGEGDEADIRLDHYVPLESGVTQQQLDDLTDEIIDSAFDFWKWARREHGL